MRKELSFTGNKITSLNEEIALMLGDWNKGEDPRNIPTYFIGKYRRKSVYKIDNFLYFFDNENSWTCNSEYVWELIEASEGCYKCFHTSNQQVA